VQRSRKRFFVTGGTGFLGYRVVRALLELSAEVTVLVKPDSEAKLGSLTGRVQIVYGDPWNPASFRGRARGHNAVIHLVGGTKPDPARGLTFRHLNYVSTRNVAQMAVSDGVPQFVLLSASTSPFGVSRGYLESKRDAEQYLKGTGLIWTIVRAPALYIPGEARNPAYRIMSILGAIPILGLLVSRYRPIPVDVAARGVASVALGTSPNQAPFSRVISPRQLRRLGRSQERRLFTEDELFSPPRSPAGDDEVPFGWLPPNR